MLQKAQFYSEGSLIYGNLNTPKEFKEDNQYPAIILCHGFCGIKEVLLPSFSDYFNDNGFVCLTFDYRGFGESEGKRERLIPFDQMTDIRNAITFLSSLSYVDTKNIGLWGTSFGGANAIWAASLDNRVKSVVAQLTFGDGKRIITGSLSQEEKEKLETTLKKVHEREVIKNKPLLLSPDQILSDPDSKAFYKKMLEKFPQIETKLPLSTLKNILEFSPENLIRNVNVPVCIIAAENDIVCPPLESESLFKNANEQKEFYLIKNAQHYEVYEGESFTLASEKAASWFKKTLTTNSKTAVLV